MKGSGFAVALVAVISALSFGPVSAETNPVGQQAPMTREQAVQQFCHAASVTSGPDADTMSRVNARLGPVFKANSAGHHVNVAMINSNVINAFHVPLSMTVSWVCVPSVMARFMGSDGELAFIVAHELGHALDDTCKTEDGRSRLVVTPNRGALSSVLTALLEQSGPVTEQQACEARADEIGFNLLTRAGFSPFDAAGAFGRLEMYSGDTQTGLLARFAAMNSDHPMTPDRIQHMRAVLLRNHANNH